MQTKNIARFVQKKLAHTMAGQLQRSRPISSRIEHGECWPQSDGRQKTTMWQSPSWPAPGKNLPRDAKSVL
jgi:hypothetical protein